MAFLAYCLPVTLKARLRTLAGGTTAREVLEKFKTLPMVDVVLSTDDGRRANAVALHAARGRSPHAAAAAAAQLPAQPPTRINAEHAAAAFTEPALK